LGGRFLNSFYDDVFPVRFKVIIYHLDTNLNRMGSVGEFIVGGILFLIVIILLTFGCIGPLLFFISSSPLNALYSIFLISLITAICGFILGYTDAIRSILESGLKNPFLSYYDNIKYKSLGAEYSRKYHQDKLDSNHHAIIIGLKKRFGFWTDETVYASGIDLLVDYFNKNNIAFNITVCKNKKEAESVIYNFSAKSLWIFGHGTKTSIGFGKNDILHYCTVRNAYKKDFIGQFHCNSGEGCSLADYLLPDGYLPNQKFVVDGLRCNHQNRIDIQALLEDKNIQELLKSYNSS
jgi:hypothetical protein